MFPPSTKTNIPQYSPVINDEENEEDFMIIKDRKQKLPANTKIEINSSIDDMSGVITDNLNQLVEFENKILSKKQTHRRQKNG